MITNLLLLSFNANKQQGIELKDMFFGAAIGDAFLGHYLELDFARRSINV